MRNGNRDVCAATLAKGQHDLVGERKVSDDTGATDQFAARVGSDGSGNVMALGVMALGQRRALARRRVHMSRRAP